MNDNPESKPAAGDPRQGRTEKKILILARGGSGAQTLNALSTLPGIGGLTTLLLETDSDSAALCRADRILQAEASWTSVGRHGCGGDPMKGERAVARLRAELIQTLSGFDFIIVDVTQGRAITT